MLEGAQKPVRQRDPLPSSRPTYPLSIKDLSAGRVDRVRSRSSTRPCTSCNSWTENSTSRRPPSPSLSSRPAFRARNVSDHPFAHRLGRPRRSPSRSAARHTIGGNHVDELLAEVKITGAGPGFQHGLLLRGLGPLLVVGPVAGQGADELAGLALRPAGQRRPPRWCPRPCAPSRSWSLSAANRVAMVMAPIVVDHRLAVVAQHRLGDEEHVDVTDVVEFLGATLTETDHGQAGLQGVRAELAPGDRQRRLRALRPRDRTPRRRSSSTASIGSGAPRSRAAICSRAPRYASRSPSPVQLGGDGRCRFGIGSGRDEKLPPQLGGRCLVPVRRRAVPAARDGR